MEEKKREAFIMISDEETVDPMTVKYLDLTLEGAIGVEFEDGTYSWIHQNRLEEMQMILDHRPPKKKDRPPLSLKTKILWAMLLGAAGGIISGQSISFFMTGGSEFFSYSPALGRLVGDPHLALVLQTIVFALSGCLSLGLTVVYSIDQWSLLARTAVHFTGVFLGMFGESLVLQWFGPGQSAVMLSFFSQMLMIYIAIWLFMYYLTKRKVDAINRKLKLYKADSLTRNSP